MNRFFSILVAGIFNLAVVSASPINKPAQDSIFLKNGDIYKVKIIRLKSDTVFYRTYASEEQRFFLISDVKNLSYDDGKIYIPKIKDQENNKSAIDGLPYIAKPAPEDMFWKGNDDARRYFRGNSNFWTGYLFGILGILYYLGFLFAGISSLLMPNLPNIYKNDTRFNNLARNKVDPDNMRNVTNLFKDPEYVRGYRKSARRRKAGKIWFGVGIGFATILTVLIIILLSTY